ncbi:hypothetical protein F4X88_13565 [Candidatus Poribacteria bacterium]|nr:hypothetical protein [Candidatus Poribacteria bacterium]MXV83196.1 hypothetical protein [Candidatus Poribacteria bacterium]MYA57316.1 hypothetical protein [Candidatus Poribacteria bacterium]
MRAIDTFKMDKATFSVLSSFEKADEADKTYWHSKTPQERLEALELMRQINYDYDPVTDRLQRVLEVAEFTPS